SLPRAMSGALGTTGSAIIVTTLVLVSGFAGMMFSDYMAIFNMGLYICAALVLSLLANLLMMPAALALFVGKKQWSDRSPKG
ncbi:MMPL family transporter, partial [Myxococcota bacterium]|nr:MMPL family transporter [Myxococcota bacterium]